MRQEMVRVEYRQFVVSAREPMVMSVSTSMTLVKYRHHRANLVYGDSSRRASLDGASLGHQNLLDAPQSCEILLCCRLPDRRQIRWYP